MGAAGGPPRSRPARALAAAALLAGALPAAALDRFEIQVYGPDLDEPGQFSLELHLNYTWAGEGTAAYPGEAPLARAGQYTLEPALGVLEWLELGAYLQSYSTPATGFRFGGLKARAKMIVPRRLTGEFFLGLNVEVGFVPRAIEAEAWGAEFRPILGWSNGWGLVSLNPTFGFAFTGPDRFRVDLGPSAKAELNTQLGFGVGLEYYTSMGYLDGLPAPAGWQQMLFAVVDLLAPRGAEESPWELDVGVGRGLTGATPQQWTAKVIAGRSF